MIKTPAMYRDEPLAYFITWTTYGAWIPGDERGWVDRQGSIRDPNPRLARMIRTGPCQHAVVLGSPHRECVTWAIRRHATVRGWTLHALAVRTQHVHVVVSAFAVAPTAVAQQLKAWSTRGCRDSTTMKSKLWSRGQSIRRLYDEQGLAAVVSYVAEHQDRTRT